MTTRILGGKGNRTRRSQKASCRATTSRRPPTRYERSHTRKVNLCIIQGTAGSGKGIVLNEGNVRLVCEAPAPDSPGCLFIADDFKVNGATLTAQNVTIYVTNVEEKLTGNPLTVLDIGANSNVTMSAPLSGTYQNMLLFLSRWSTNLACNVRGDATSLIDGAIYCPTGDLDYGGNSTFDVNSGYAAVIANQIRLHGTTNVGVTFEGGTGPRTSRFSKVNMVE